MKAYTTVLRNTPLTDRTAPTVHADATRSARLFALYRSQAFLGAVDATIV